MNKQRRKWLSAVYDKITECQTELENIRDEEQEAFDNMPESLQYSERGNEMEEVISELDDEVCNLEDIAESLLEIIER